MIEALVTRGVPQAEAEQELLKAIEGETQAEVEAREQAEAAAERRRQYEEQQAFIRMSPMGLPGMGARVRSGKGRG